jgi:hypothetical protein
MRVTIVKPDGFVGIDGEFLPVNMDSLEQTLRVVQWDGQKGHVEWTDRDNTDITSMVDFQPVIDAWHTAKEALLASLVEPVKTIEEIKNSYLAAAQAEKKRVKDGRFLLDGILFDSDDAANIAYLQLQVKLGANPDYIIRWKASAGVWITMDATIFTSVAAGLEAHYSACFAWQEAKEIEIASCTTAAELEAVSVVFGE